MHRFYCEKLEFSHEHFTLNEVESNHACKVLRLKEGSHVELINGRGLLATAELTLSHHKRSEVKILEKTQHDAPQKLIQLAICPTKSNDRFEWFLEKAVEIGVDRITPLISENSERSKLNFERLDKVIISAVKQSLRTYKPLLNEPQKVKEFLKSHPGSFIAHCNSGFQRIELKDLSWDNEVTLLIGPEGDFSASEIETALQHESKSVSLGNNRLRTETAGLVGVTLLNAFRT